MKLSTTRRNAEARLDATFAALVDPTRRAILARLATGTASVMELAAPFGEATDWLDRCRRFWDDSFARLDDVLADLKNKEKDHGRID